jgi:hypothetical protein
MTGRYGRLLSCTGAALVAACLMTLLTFTVRGAPAQQGPPTSLSGVAYVNDELAPVGTLVEAKIGGDVVGSDLVEEPDGSFRFTLTDGNPGDTVYFYVGGFETPEFADWWTGSFETDLHVQVAALDADVVGTGDLAVGAPFVATAVITNVGQKSAITITAGISVSEGVDLVAGESAVKPIASSLGVGVSRTVTWTLVYTTRNPFTLTVSPFGLDQPTAEPIPAPWLRSDSLVVDPLPYRVYMPLIGRGLGRTD